MVGLRSGIRIHCPAPSNPPRPYPYGEWSPELDPASYLHYSQPSSPPPTSPNISTQVEKALTHFYTQHPSPPVIVCLSYPSLPLLFLPFIHPIRSLRQHFSNVFWGKSAA